KWHQDCASTVAAIAEPLPNDLPQWNERARSSYSAFSSFSYSDNPWRRLHRKSIDTIQITSRSEAILVGLLGSHNDGYVRESVLVRLGQIQTGDELGFLILRTNDWVPAVQIRAHTAGRPRLFSKSLTGNCNSFRFLGKT